MVERVYETLDLVNQDRIQQMGIDIKSLITVNENTGTLDIQKKVMNDN